MSDLFDLSEIDWNKCDIDARSTIFKDIVELWNSGIDNTVEISKIINKTRHTVREYLTIATNCGLCNYDAKIEREKAMKKMHDGNEKAVICIETGEVFQSITKAANSRPEFNHQGISACCRYRHKTHKGFRWMFYNDYLSLDKEEI